MIKALFFDIDGTLVSFKTHAIPASTVEALRRAKDRGVKIFISTGRPFSLINNLSEIEDLIDGYITTNGAYSFIGDETVSISPIAHEEVKRVIEFADMEGVSCMVVGEKDIVMHNPTTKADDIFGKLLNVHGLRTDVFSHCAQSEAILQLTPVIDEEQQRRLQSLLKSVEITRWCPDFADITAKGVDKAKGLAEIAHRCGFQHSETMAFGDGGNDVSIIREAGIGVAMGNANRSLIDVADYVTDAVDEDGIYNALIHFDII